MEDSTARSIGLRGAGLMAGFSFLLTGCSSPLPPYVVLFDSYFPSWLVCFAAGCVAALLMRVLLVRWGVDEYIPFHLLTYLAVAATVAFLLSLLIFAR